MQLATYGDDVAGVEAAGAEEEGAGGRVGDGERAALPLDGVEEVLVAEGGRGEGEGQCQEAAVVERGHLGVVGELRGLRGNLRVGVLVDDNSFTNK